MGKIYNNQRFEERRRELRRNQSEAEKVLWGRLRSKQLNGLKFFRQYSIGAYILDFYCPRLKLAVELDGGQHAEDGIREYDEIRVRYLETYGIEVMRFWNNDILRNIEGVLNAIAESADTKKLSEPLGMDNPS